MRKKGVTRTNAQLLINATAPGLSPLWMLTRGPRLSISHLMMPSQHRQRNSSIEVCLMELIRTPMDVTSEPLTSLPW